MDCHFFFFLPKLSFKVLPGIHPLLLFVCVFFVSVAAGAEIGPVSIDATGLKPTQTVAMGDGGRAVAATAAAVVVASRARAAAAATVMVKAAATTAAAVAVIPRMMMVTMVGAAATRAREIEAGPRRRRCVRPRTGMTMKV